MQYIYSILIGHNRNFCFLSTHSDKDIAIAYKNFCKTSGFTLDNDKEHRGHIPILLLNDDDNCVIPIETIKSLKEFGVDFSFRNNEFDDNGELFCEPIDIANLFLQLVKIILREFRYEILHDPVSINGPGSVLKRIIGQEF